MCKNLNNVPFLCTKLFKKRGHYSRGDIIQRGTLFKEIRYVQQFSAWFISTYAFKVAKSREDIFILSFLDLKSCTMIDNVKYRSTLEICYNFIDLFGILLYFFMFFPGKEKGTGIRTGLGQLVFRTRQGIAANFPRSISNARSSDGFA